MAILAKNRTTSMRWQTNLRRLVLSVLAVIVITGLVLCGGSQVAAQNGDANRRLSVAVLGYELNGAAAKEALASGADINWKNDAMNGETLLIRAIKSFNDAKVVKFLLDNGADPNIKDDSGRTALSWARQYKIENNANGRAIITLLNQATHKDRQAA